MTIVAIIFLVAFYGAVTLGAVKMGKDMLKCYKQDKADKEAWINYCMRNPE